ncbi:NUDIX domain-containing protein [Sphingomonas panacisoli]|uniref:NUDIX domain-containing protein n=1 Tax=Sphingomonas panacisoli TaxID=1813879 RepID=A0A5B8LE46_9SPHN|nr:NUDIX domain-containing protein [Sphingomonas panacisoli]QDZ06458.1 NUDIX domain-containing protein [Sphingomonas panacisoli]
MSRTPRPAARILLVDGDGRILMFRFTPEDGRPPFWCTVGGAVDPGESYEAAARRELYEETGIIADPGPEIFRRKVDFLTIEGVEVTADERYFLVRTDAREIDTGAHTELEQRVMQQWRWVAPADLAALGEQYFPEDLPQMLAEVL